MAGFLAGIFVLMLSAIVAAVNGDSSGIYGFLRIIGVICVILLFMYLVSLT